MLATITSITTLLSCIDRYRSLLRRFDGFTMDRVRIDSLSTNWSLFLGLGSNLCRLSILTIGNVEMSLSGVDLGTFSRGFGGRFLGFGGSFSGPFRGPISGFSA